MTGEKIFGNCKALKLFYFFSTSPTPGTNWNFWKILALLFPTPGERGNLRIWRTFRGFVGIFQHWFFEDLTHGARLNCWFRRVEYGFSGWNWILNFVALTSTQNVFFWCQTPKNCSRKYISINNNSLTFCRVCGVCLVVSNRQFFGENGFFHFSKIYIDVSGKNH